MGYTGGRAVLVLSNGALWMSPQNVSEQKREAQGCTVLILIITLMPLAVSLLYLYSNTLPCLLTIHCCTSLLEPCRTSLTIHCSTSATIHCCISLRMHCYRYEPNTLGVGSNISTYSHTRRRTSQLNVEILAPYSDCIGGDWRRLKTYSLFTYPLRSCMPSCPMRCTQSSQPPQPCPHSAPYQW